VLIVEDDRSARRAIALILRRRGFAVSEAGTVAEAIAHLIAQRRAPQWILLDLMLPDGLGVDVIRKVRSEHVPSRICIITGCAPDVAREAERAGAEITFTKPLDVDRLISVLAPPHGPAV
jgi:DNA-binding response OmpR family regulator